MIDHRYTRHQVVRGSRPDAISGDTWYLIKNVSELRLTYQIRLLTFLAEERGLRLIIRLPEASRMSKDLRDFMKVNSAVLRVRKAG